MIFLFPRWDMLVSWRIVFWIFATTRLFNIYEEKKSGCHFPKAWGQKPQLVGAQPSPCCSSPLSTAQLCLLAYTTNSSPLKNRPKSKRKQSYSNFQPSIFRCNDVSFRVPGTSREEITNPQNCIVLIRRRFFCLVLFCGARMWPVPRCDSPMTSLLHLSTFLWIYILNILMIKLYHVPFQYETQMPRIYKLKKNIM